MSAKLNPDVHNNIKALRVRTGKMQKEVAHDLGVKLDRYRAWEQRKHYMRPDTTKAAVQVSQLLDF